MKTRLVTFGEIMLRLKAPGTESLLETPRLEATFGGAEANVALALASWGISAAYVTCLPDRNPIADAAIVELSRAGVDTSHIVRGPGRMGVYYLAHSEDPNADRVVYDRQDSAIALAEPGDFDWPRVFESARWFHITGITPALSAAAAELSGSAMREARRMGLTVSVDLNYREKLWRWGRPAEAVLTEMARSADFLIGSARHLRMLVGGVEGDAARLAEDALDRFPELSGVGITFRRAAPSGIRWSACFHDGRELVASRVYEITKPVGRSGAGDAFSAGLIFGCLQPWDPARTLEFAAAAGYLKHSVPGDSLRSSPAEIRVAARRR